MKPLYWSCLLVLLLSLLALPVLAAPVAVTYSGDLVLSACLLASSTGTGTVQNVGDDSNSTFWSSSVVPPQWVRCDFGATPRLIRRITMRSTTGFGAHSAEDFAVQYSDDLVTWTTVATMGPQTGWGSGEKRTFSWGPVGVPARYWRVYVTKTENNDRWSFAELEMMEVISEDDPTATPVPGTSTPTPLPTSTPDISFSAAASEFSSGVVMLGFSDYLPLVGMLALALALFFGLAKG